MKTVQAQCPSCSVESIIPANKTGQRILCRICKQYFFIPPYKSIHCISTSFIKKSFQTEISVLEPDTCRIPKRSELSIKRLTKTKEKIKSLILKRRPGLS